MNMNPSEFCAVVGAIDPDVTAAGSVSTGWVNAKNFDRFMAIAQAGTLGTNATFDAKVEQAQDSSGTGAKDLRAITQLTQAGSDDSDQQALINVRNQELDLENDFNHIRLTITVATATSDAAGLLLGFSPIHYPASDSDAASVAEIV